jgi:hypothetical protein
MISELADFGFGPQARNRLSDATDPGHSGAIAALETFYYALNNADLKILASTWSPNPLAQLNNPLGGVLRSGEAVAELYGRIFAGNLDVQVTFTDAASYKWPGVAVFAGREVGSYRDPSGQLIPLKIRTTRIFGFDQGPGRWLQIHHHGSIEEPEALRAYQQAAASPR